MEKQPICDCEVIHEDVVNSVREKMSDRDEYIELAALFKIFGDGTRVQILYALEQSEMCVCDIACLLGMTKSAVSHQLKNLRHLKLVKSRREGKNIFYSLADDHVGMIIKVGLEHLKEF